MTTALPDKANDKDLMLSSLYSTVDELYFTSSVQITNEIALLILMSMLSTST